MKAALVALGDFRAFDAFIVRVLLRRVGLARQQCLVDEKIPGFEEAPIRRNQIPGGEQHDIAGDEVLPQHRRSPARRAGPAP